MKGGNIVLDEELLERCKKLGEDFGVDPKVTTLLIAEYEYQKYLS